MIQHSDKFTPNSAGFSDCFSRKGLLYSNRIALSCSCMHLTINTYTIIFLAHSINYGNHFHFNSGIYMPAASGAPWSIRPACHRTPL